MSVIYFYAEDEKHFKADGIEQIKKKYSIAKIEVCFEENEINKLILESLKNHKNLYVLTPFYFHGLFIKYSSFTKLIRLPNANGILTSQDIKLKIKAEEKLKSKLNSSITKPTLTFNDYGGAKDLVNETETINLYFKLGIPVKGIFLAGIPGTGKSFFAKCLAGQLNRYLIELNLTKFMKSENSIILIEEFFDFFKTNPGDYIIWLDEIEKMFTGTDESTQLLGTLLTKINDFNSSSNSKSTAFIVATANDVYSLSHRNPEFFRNGRFDILISLNPPSDKGAKEIFNIYIKKCQKENRNILLSSVYLSYKKELKLTSSDKNQNSAMNTINLYVEENYTAIESFIKEHNIKNKKEFINVFDKISTYFTKSLFEDLETKKFSFDVSTAIGMTFEIYRNKCENQIKFPYVPAEIEFFVNSLYKHYLFCDIHITDSIMKTYIEKIKPLQASMSDQISKMNGVTSDFRQV